MDTISIIGLISSIYLSQLFICLMIIVHRNDLLSIPATGKNIIKFTFLPTLVWYLLYQSIKQN